MQESLEPFRNIGLAREKHSPENPGNTESRVALLPDAVAKLVAHGCRVAVEAGAGARLGIDDRAYVAAGAVMQNGDAIYEGKDLVLKFKGPADAIIGRMDPGSTLFCMAHVASFPHRARLCEAQRVNLIAMEHVVESPKYIARSLVVSKVAMQRLLAAHPDPCEDLVVHFVGFSERFAGAIRRAANRHPKELRLWQADTPMEMLDIRGTQTVVCFDSEHMPYPARFEAGLHQAGATVLDLARFDYEEGDAAVRHYRQTHPPFSAGLRRIQCLHETGRAGARYGLSLLAQRGEQPHNATVTVLGCGNVGMGAIEECYRQGVRQLHILGRRHTQPGTIEPYLTKSDLIINGAELPAQERGKRYLVRLSHHGEVLRRGAVVIDLVGGSESNRSAVEAVVRCTFPHEPTFERDGVLYSAVWGWPLMGMQQESAERYSAQIVSVLLGRERLIDGLATLSPGVAPALLCGPFERSVASL